MTRLVLLLKSGPGSGPKIAHQGGYAMYGNPPRWHKITAEKPAPKGAPVSHHPEAAGVHEPAQHFTDAQWEQLKLPDSNVNAPSYNAALAKLKAWSEAGNVTAIVAAGYGTNTYGKKLATIANQLLKMHGSVHQVASGQKAGEHVAVAAVGDKPAKATGTPAEQGAAAFHAGKPASPAHDAGFAAKVAGKPDAAQKMNEWSSGYAEAKAAATQKPAGPLVAPEFTEGKTTTGVKALYDHTASKIIDHGHAGNLSVLQDMVNPDKKMWQGKTPNSKKLVQLHAQALAYAAGAQAPGAASTSDGSLDGLKLPAAVKEYLLKPSVTMKDGKTISAKEYVDGLLADGYGNPEYFAAPKGSQAGFLTKPGKPKVTLNDKQMFYADAAFMAQKKAAKAPPPPVPAPAEHGAGWDKAEDGSDVYANHPKEDAGPKEGDTKPGADGKNLVFKNGRWHKYVDVDEHGELPAKLVPVNEPADVKPEHFEVNTGDVFKLDSQYQKMNAGEWVVYNISADGAQVYMHKVGAKVPNQTNSATIPAATLAEAVAKGTAKKQPAAPAVGQVDGPLKDMMLGAKLESYSKEQLEDYAANHPNEKIKAHAQATLAAKHGVSHPKPETAPKPAPAQAPAVTPETGNLSAQHLQNLQSIPWFKLKLPDSNTNAKSHNAALAKIEAMAFAGDKAGLQAFIDAKAGAKQTYAKKQALVAQTALAALGAEGATAAVPVEPAPSADKVTELTPKQIEGLKGWFAAGQPTSKHPDSWSNLWRKLSPGMKAAVKAEIEAPAPAPAVADKYPLVNEWKAAISAGKVPTKAQADAYEALVEHDPDAATEYFMGAVNNLIPEDKLNDDGAFDDALQEAHSKAFELHGHALNGTKPAAAAAPVTADTPLTQGQKDAVGKLSLDDMKAIIDTPLPPNVAAYVKKQIARAEKPAAPVKVKADAKLYTNTIDGHNKFWAVSVHGSTLKTTYGKNGTKGQETVKQFPSEAAAKAAADKLKSEKQGKGYQFVGYTEHEHDAAPGSAPVEQGPKEGDTKMGADGMLVLKDGHWVKMNTGDDGAGDWAFNAEDPGMSGAATVGNHEGLIAFLPGQVAEFHTEASMEAGDGEPALQAETVQELVQKMAAAGHSVPPLAMLQKLDPGYQPAKPAGFKKLTHAEIGEAISSVSSGQTVFSTNAHGKAATKAATKGDAAGMAAAYKGAKQAMKFPKTAQHIKAVAGAMGVDTSGWDAGNYEVKAAHAGSAAPAAPASPAGGLPSMDGWVKTGEQQGSNAGGKFKDPDGQEWYCKWPDDAEAAKSEVLAAKLYALAGLSSQDCMLVSKGGKTAIATKWVNIKKAASATALAKVEGVHQGFAVDAWLGNWDVVGMSLDNLQVGPDGKAHRVDAGGSLEYRAQGEKKPFGSKVEEIDTLRDAAKNPHAAAVFAKMTKADIAASVAKVAAISDIAIRAMVNQFGPGDDAAKKKLADTLIARKADLVSKYPQAAKPKKKPKFDPAKVSAPPSFLNWGGTGKSGPSSKAFLNQANEDAVQAIYAAAKTGDMDAVKKLTAPVYDKDSGKATGQKPVLDHPSQHVKGYAQQVINEINYQLNPPKRFRFDGGHPLHALNHAYPAHKGAKSSAVAQKLGKFIVLGDPGKVSLEDVGLPAKIKHAEGGGTLSTSTYAAAAKAAFAKMPTTQKQAVQSYTGSSYHAMNGSLWSGNPSGAAKAAGEALKTLGHDIAPGTVLSRKISVHGDDLNQLLAATGKILEEPAIMSTSIRPSSWSGNVHLKLHIGPGVKGLWVGQGSSPTGGAMSKHGGEDEMILPPNTRLLVLSSKPGGMKDADGFGGSSSHVIECIVLPTQ